MEELNAVRVLIDHGERRLHDEQPDSPLLRLSRPEQRRILAVAAYRELRALRREIEEESSPAPD